MAKQAKSEKIISWLIAHPAIDKGVICDKVGYDAGNMKKAMNGGRSIPAKYLDPLEKELEKYGYKK